MVYFHFYEINHFCFHKWGSLSLCATTNGTRTRSISEKNVYGWQAPDTDNWGIPDLKHSLKIRQIRVCRHYFQFLKTAWMMLQAEACLNVLRTQQLL